MPEPHKTKDFIDQSWYKRYPRDEIAETSVLNGEEYGILQRFRDYSLIHGGIEDDKELIRRIGATFHLSRYKLNKVWNRIENFFTLRDGRFVYEQDEQERHQLFIISAKRSLAGKLGAAARWSDRNAPGLEPPKSGMANAIGTTVRLPSENPRELEPEPELETRGDPPPPPTPASNPGSGGGGAPPSQEVVPDEDYRRIAQRALDLGMAVPERSLAVKIRAKFGERPIESVVAALVRWPGQEHAGLWGSKSVDDFDLESARQASGGDRKPTAKEEHQRRMMEDARRQDEARRKGAGG